MTTLPRVSLHAPPIACRIVLVVLPHPDHVHGLGTVIGVCFGFILCTLLKHYKIHELTGDIYYFTTSLPVKLEALDVFLIVSATFVICYLATLYPAHQASKLDPVEAIRYG